MKKGWRNDRLRHSLARKGIKTKYINIPHNDFTFKIKPIEKKDDTYYYEIYHNHKKYKGKYKLADKIKKNYLTFEKV